jgi:hypothetical protein
LAGMAASLAAPPGNTWAGTQRRALPRPHAARFQLLGDGCQRLWIFRYRGLSQVLTLAASPLTPGCAKACPLWVRQIL